MSIWLFLDVLLLKNPEIIPCFFLLGFITDKKVSWISILTVSIFFDWFLYSTKYVFFCICCILKLFSFFLTKMKCNVYIKYFLLFLLFLFLLNIKEGNSIQNLWNQNILNTYLISNVFLFCYIKWKHHS